MKTYAIIAAVGVLIFVGGFYFLFRSFNTSGTSTKEAKNETAILGQLDNPSLEEYKKLNNAEFEEQAIPLNDESMSQL